MISASNSCLNYCPDFHQWWIVTWKYKRNKSLLCLSCFWPECFFITATERKLEKNTRKMTPLASIGNVHTLMHALNNTYANSCTHVHMHAHIQPPKGYVHSCSKLLWAAQTDSLIHTGQLPSWLLCNTLPQCSWCQVFTPFCSLPHPHSPKSWLPPPTHDSARDLCALTALSHLMAQVFPIKIPQLPSSESSSQTDSPRGQIYLQWSSCRL